MPSKDKRKVSLKVARKPSTNEWVVKVYFDGVYSDEHSYYTDDKQDALDTATFMADRFGVPVPNGIADWFGSKTKAKTPPYITLLLKLIKQYDKRAKASVSPDFKLLSIVWDGDSHTETVEIEAHRGGSLELITTIAGVVCTFGGDNPNKVVTEFFERVMI